VRGYSEFPSRLLTPLPAPALKGNDERTPNPMAKRNHNETSPTTDDASAEVDTTDLDPNAPPTNGHAATAADHTHDDDDDEFITLGRSRPSWKPGKHGGITGFLLGESGVPKQDGDVAAIFVVRLTEPAQASIWDKSTETESWKTYPRGTEVQIFITRGLEDLRPYARDPAGIVKIRLPEGKQIKAGKGKFWDLSPKQVGKKLYPRTEDDKIEKAPLPRAARAVAAPSNARRNASTEVGDDEIPF
jgi:hypothetical protein